MQSDQEKVVETWASFWGDLLVRRSHQDNPQRWTARHERADWLIKTLDLPSGTGIIDLGCGDGVLDVCLAKRGYHVTAVDRIAAVLEAARQEASAHEVEVDFVVADLRSYDFGGSTFDAAIFFEILGLIERETEVRLLRRLRQALNPGARAFLDAGGGGATRCRRVSAHPRRTSVIGQRSLAEQSIAPAG